MSLRRALDELIDEISEVKQASWLTSGPQHAALVDLKSYLVRSVQRIVAGQDEPGRAPFAILSPSARPVVKLDATTPEDVIELVGRHLVVLTQHTASRARSVVSSDARGSTLLADIASGLGARRRSLEATTTTTGAARMPDDVRGGAR